VFALNVEVTLKLEAAAHVKNLFVSIALGNALINTKQNIKITFTARIV